jgi:hypothetical protein
MRAARYCRSCGRSFIPAEHYHRLCLPCWRARAEAEAQRAAWLDGYEAGRASRPAPALPPGLMRDLLLLCHPDHQPPERAALAHRATVALLAMRGAEGHTPRRTA